MEVGRRVSNSGNADDSEHRDGSGTGARTGEGEATAYPDPQDLHRPPDDEPVFNAPPAVIALIVLMVAVMLVRASLSEDADLQFVLMLALIPARYAGLAGELPGGDLASLTSLFTHMAVHADTAHLMFNGASLLAFGGAIEKRIGAARMLAFFCVCGLAGALAFLAVNPGLLAPMIGASGAIAGLMGGMMRFLFPSLDHGGIRQLHERPGEVRSSRLGIALRDRRVLIATVAFVIMNIAAMLGLGDVSAGGAIAWEAHIGGYFAGLLLFGLFDAAPRNSPPHQPFDV